MSENALKDEATIYVQTNDLFTLERLKLQPGFDVSTHDGFGRNTKFCFYAATPNATPAPTEI